MSESELVLHAIRAECADLERRFEASMEGLRADLVLLGQRIDALDGEGQRIAQLEEHRMDLFELRSILEEMRAKAEGEADAAEAEDDAEGAADAATEAADAEETIETVEDAIEEVSEVIADAEEAADRAPEGAEEINPTRTHFLTRRVLGRGRESI